MVLACANVQGEDNTSVQLEKVKISAHSFDQGQHEMSQPATLLSDEDLQRQKAQSLGETLSNQAGIHNASYGNAVGRPVVRGMSGARVKVLQDGIDTLDASAISPDHGVNADTHSAQKIEVLRGPATLMYGSGAFGGVVNVVDERIPTGLTEASTAVSLQFDSVNQGKTIQGSHTGLTELSQGNEVHWYLSGKHFRSDEYELPELAEHEEHHEGETEEEHEEHAGEEKLANSDTSYSNQLTLGTSYVFPSGYAGIAVSSSKSEYGLPGHVHHEEHHEGETEAEHEQHESEGARIQMRQQRVDLDSRFDQPMTNVEAMKFKLGFNNYRHDELEDGAVGTRFRRQGFEGRTELLLTPVANISQALGIQFSQDKFKAAGDEAVLPETDSLTAGLFWLGKTQLNNWGLELGARVEQSQLAAKNVTSLDSHCETLGLSLDQFDDKTFNSHSLSLGLVHDFTHSALQDWQLTSSVTSAQRAPSAQELYSCGAHAATQTYDVGNPNLNNEQALNIELGLRKTQGKITSSFNIFQNQIGDFIYAQNTGNEIDGFGQYQFVQEDVTFVGGEFNLAYEITDGLAINTMADRVRADDLPRIPADRIGLGVEMSTMALFSSSSDWRLFAQWLQVQKQDQVADNEEVTLGHDLVSLGLSYEKIYSQHELGLDIKVNNLLDEEIRQHTSFVKEQAPQPGRNISLAITTRF